MIKPQRINRRAFLKRASLTAVAGATGTAANLSSAQAGGDTHTPRLADGSYDFDTPYNRRGSNCSRWDLPPLEFPDGEFKYGMGVASMDFECPPCITEALQERIKHHNWGYIGLYDSLTDCIIRWNGERKKVDLTRDMITLSDGVYPGIIAALRSLVPAHGKALLPTPAYSGFYAMARDAHVQVVDSRMNRVNGRYTFDFADIEAKLSSDAEIRALILCNPQNPTGMVWTREELLRLGRLCLENGVVVLADEIHSDVVRSGISFTPFITLPDQAVVNNSLTFGAISKTFSLAGMKNGYYYSNNRKLLERVNDYHRAELSTLGVVANEAAYHYGGEWFDQCNAYMDGNHSFIEDYIRQNMPTVGYTRNEGTYMTFVDFSQTMAAIDADAQAQAVGAKTPEFFFRDWLVRQSGVYFAPGSEYGSGGQGHVRMNIASSRLVLKEVLDGLAAVVNRV